MNKQDNLIFQISGLSKDANISKKDIIEIVKTSLSYKNFFRKVKSTSVKINIIYNPYNRTVSYETQNVSGNIYV